MRALGIQNSFGFTRVGIATGIGFGEAIGAKPFARSEFRYVFLFLFFGAVQQNRHRANAGMGTKGRRKRARCSRNVIADQTGVHKAHAQSTISFGHSNAQKTQFGSFAHAGFGKCKIALFKAQFVGPNFFVDKFGYGIAH